MLKKIMQTDARWEVTVLRLAMAIIIFPHGLQKTFGWFGGLGFSAQLQGFENGLNIPSYIAILPILAESLGGLGMVIGALTRIAAFGICCNMVIAAIVHAHFGLFMNWSGKQPGEGIEFHIAMIGALVVLMVKGGGALSVDRWFSSGSAGAVAPETATAK